MQPANVGSEVHEADLATWQTPFMALLPACGTSVPTCRPPDQGLFTVELTNPRSIHVYRERLIHRREDEFEGLATTAGGYRGTLADGKGMLLHRKVVRTPLCLIILRFGVTNGASCGGRYSSAPPHAADIHSSCRRCRKQGCASREGDATATATLMVNFLRRSRILDFLSFFF